MKKEVKKIYHLPASLKTVLVISFIMYLWYFVSALIIPLSKFLSIPDPLLLTINKMLSFPISLLGFVICISLISTVIILIQFNEQKYTTKIILIEGTSLVLHYIIPIAATFLILLFIALNVIKFLPSVKDISFFLEDLFLFTTFLFILTAILNIAIQKIIKINSKK